MTDYRCYLLDACGAIRFVEEIGANSDADAVSLARTVFAQQPHFRGFELWQRTRRVHCEERQESGVTPLPSAPGYRSAQQ